VQHWVHDGHAARGNGSCQLPAASHGNDEKRTTSNPNALSGAQGEQRQTAVASDGNGEKRTTSIEQRATNNGRQE